MRYLFTSLLIGIASLACSQPSSLDSAEVKNATIEFNGGNYNGYLIELNAPPEMVEDAIKGQFKLQGINPKETKNFMVYRNVIMPLIDSLQPMDAFIKVERKSRKEKEQTIVYFIATLPGEIPEDKLKSGGQSKSAGALAMKKGGAFLTGLIPGIKQGVYDKDLDNQRSQLKKEEKKLATLVDDLADMERKLKKLQSDIEFNKKAQERQTAEIEKARNAYNESLSKNPSKGGQ